VAELHWLVMVDGTGYKEVAHWVAAAAMRAQAATAGTAIRAGANTVVRPIALEGWPRGNWLNKVKVWAGVEEQRGLQSSGATCHGDVSASCASCARAAVEMCDHK
jgi:hypothetical protein